MISMINIRLLIALVAVLAVIGGYFYWKHTVSEQGYNACMVEVTKRDDYTMKQSERIREEAKQQYNEEKIKNETAYNNAIRTYADYAIRMRDTAKASATNSNKIGMSTKTCDTGGADRTSEEIIQGIKEFNLSVKACELIVEQFVVPNFDVK